MTVEIAPGTRIRMVRRASRSASSRTTYDEDDERRRRGRRGDRPGTVSAEAAPARARSSRPNRPASPKHHPRPRAIQDDPELSSFITAADRVMEGLGYTEHGFRHANLTARIAFNVLSRAGFDSTRRTSRAWPATCTTSGT